MPSLVGRLFLFVLLALDWAADPTLLAPAVELLAQAWGSTENVCPSAGYQRDVLWQCRPDPGAGRAASAAAPAAPPGPPGSASQATSAPAPVSPAYVFMSLLR
jgi:hypothetical protein